MNKGMTTTSPNTVKSTKTTFKIIETIQALDGASVTEVSNQLGFSKSNVHKYFKTLEEERYIVKDENNNYHVGLRFLSLGVEARHRWSIYETAKPQIIELAEESNEMANLLVEEHGKGIFLYRANSSQAVNLDTHAGREVYLHTTALGKTILANLPKERVNAIIEQHGLPGETDKTLTNKEELFSEFENIRKRGWARDDEERLKGLRCVAGAILDSDGTVLGAISVSGPRSRMNGQKWKKDVPEMILQAKNIIELNITFN